jgi:hypothetical protein
MQEAPCPTEMLGSLAAGATDGFCAGAPLRRSQVLASRLCIPPRSDRIMRRNVWRSGLPRRQKPGGLHDLLAAVEQAAAVCAMPEHRAMLAALLLRSEYLALPAPVIAASLAPEAGGPVFVPLRAITADPADARCFVREITHWAHASAGIEDPAAALYCRNIAFCPF